MALPDHTLLFDGECTLCRRSLRWVRWLDRNGRIDAVPYQSFDSGSRPDLSAQACGERMHLLTPDGGVLTGADAVRHILGMRIATKPFAVFIGLPGVRWAAARAYALIAARRHRCTVTDRECMRLNR